MEKFLLLNDHPDLQLMAHPFVYPANSYKDLDFLISKGVTEATLLPKFIIFFNNLKDAENACRYLRNCLHVSLQLKIRYFHSTMTQDYREEKVDTLCDSKTFGYLGSELYSMVSQVSDLLQSDSN